MTVMRWQVWVARQVLARNRRESRSDPPIIVRDRQADPPHDWFMAQAVRFDGQGLLQHHKDSGGVFFETDGPVHFDGLVPGLDPIATRPDVGDGHG